MTPARAAAKETKVFICRENPRRSRIALFPDRPKYCRDIGKFEVFIGDNRHFYLSGGCGELK